MLKAGHCPDVMGQVVGESHGCSFEHDHMVSRCLGIAPEPTVIYKAKRYMSHPGRREVQFLPRGTVPFLKRWGLGAHDQLGNGTTFGPSHIPPRSSISMPEFRFGTAGQYINQIRPWSAAFLSKPIQES